MKDMILFPEDIEHLNIILEQLTVKANLLLAVLINKDGRLLTYQGSLEKIDTVSMAALVAGNSASTLAIANLMGETEFSTMYHQGKDRHIFIAVVDENTFLCLVFDDRTNIDRVKVFARQFDRQIKNALIQVYNKTEDQVDLDLDMSTPGQHAFPTDSRGFFQSTDQQSTLLKPDPSGGPFPPSPTGGSASLSPLQKASTGGEEALFTDNQAPPRDRGVDNPHDTNYLYLKKKIRETVSRKKEQ
ncbi:MAG: roadblock/LC7 domain-containing protein [Chitinispirillaceae bacterium]|nr:roadblock/LC7 domain-containing protein [Chitinispirillaceae bacterium]